MSEDASPPSSPHVGDSVTKLPRNRNVRCNGRTVIRYKQDDKEGHRRGDPILDEDGARQYRPCEGWAANDTDYCAAHGGSAPQTINAARRALALAAENAVAGIIATAIDERLPAETRLKAQAQILDRIGVRAGVDVALEAPGWQKLMADAFGAEESSEDERARDDEAADPGGVIRERVRKLNTRKANPPAVAPTPPAEETKPRRAPAKRAKAAPPEAKPKFEGW